VDADTSRACVSLSTIGFGFGEFATEYRIFSGLQPRATQQRPQVSRGTVAGGQPDCSTTPRYFRQKSLNRVGNTRAEEGTAHATSSTPPLHRTTFSLLVPNRINTMMPQVEERTMDTSMIVWAAVGVGLAIVVAYLVVRGL
jgi:hypothetical protein